MTDPFGKVLPSVDINNQDVSQLRATLLLKPSDNFTNSTLLTFSADNNRGSLQAQFYPTPDKIVNGVTVTQAPIPASVATPGVTPRLFYTNIDLRHAASSTWAVINTSTLKVGDNLTVKNIFGYINASGVTAKRRRVCHRSSHRWM